MNFMKILLLISGFFFIRVKGFDILSYYYQNDYDVQLQRALITKYNKTLFKYIKFDFVPFNRTTRVINSTTLLLMDFSENVPVQVQFYKFMSNEYRYFPITGVMDACYHFNKNSFNIRETMKNLTNAGACPWKKGLYHISNYAPDYSRMPPYVPRGEYKMNSVVLHGDNFAFELDAYFVIKDKPIWEK